MSPQSPPDPVVLAIAGHDPCGGAGIQADIEAILANGGRPVTLVTALTAQNTQLFESVIPVNPEHLRRQAELLFADLEVRVIKLGLVPNTAIADALAGVLDAHPALPVVLDPVLGAGTGTPLADEATVAALRALLARATVVTPNSPEARRLAATDNLDDAAARLLEAGCRHVFVTGTHEDTAEVHNTLYSPTRRMTWTWERLPHSYHGSGCTLASAIAAWLARGVEIDSAVTLAQEYTWNALRHGQRIGRGQYHPGRMFPLTSPRP